MFNFYYFLGKMELLKMTVYGSTTTHFLLEMSCNALISLGHVLTE
jgi:hypothetical protein